MAKRSARPKKPTPRANRKFQLPGDPAVTGAARIQGASDHGVAAGSALERKLIDTDAVVRAQPFNRSKPAEYERESATAPAAGLSVAVPGDVSASTLTEDRASRKAGGAADPGRNAAHGSLDRVRVDSGGRSLTTNQGVAVADNQHMLRAGARGPALLEDFVFREKLTHFDHERIPERVVHARGSAAHGYFESYEDLSAVTMAAPFADPGKRTPVFVRFSTVLGERGSPDLARDVRGFAVKFYTEQGNWDLVGNNMPVFFVQDAMKFPDLVHAAKPEPHHAMPQAASAHDTFWDFAGLMPEITHMLMWAMSDRAIPRSYRMMQGFGVHTFRFVNLKGAATLVKFHWLPVLGTHSVVWDEAVRINGADPDFHRRDLWEAIETGNFPEWELAVQLFTEREAEGFSFDVLDATKIVPEELVPLRPVGRMVLDRNPDNFFAETEQVAFCTQHVVPGIDFTNDPLLQGRNFSYLDTQLSRLGGPNFHEIPINAPLRQVHNNQRDGLHRQAIARGRVAYEPNSLGGGCPFQAGATGFVSFPEAVQDSKLRVKPERFAEHYLQATLFWNSQTPAEQAHLVDAFCFELGRVQVPAIRQRMVAGLRNVDDGLAARVASGLGMELPEPLPRAQTPVVHPEVTHSAALSLLARPGDGTIRTRRIALLVAEGTDVQPLLALRDDLLAWGAVPIFVGTRLGPLQSDDIPVLQVDVTPALQPSVLFDALVLPSGARAIDALLADRQMLAFVTEQYQHGKTILALPGAERILEAVGVHSVLADGEPDPGIVMAGNRGPDVVAETFAEAVARHRHFERQLDVRRIR